MGKVSLIPRTFVLIVVQRQAAASMSPRPRSSEQHGSFGGVPRFWLIKPNKLAQLPSFAVSRGHLTGLEGEVEGFGEGFGVGLCEGGEQEPVVEETKEKQRRFRHRRRTAMTNALDAITYVN